MNTKEAVELYAQAEVLIKLLEDMKEDLESKLKPDIDYLSEAEQSYALGQESLAEDLLNDYFKE